MFTELKGANKYKTYEYRLERQAAQIKDRELEIEMLEIIIENREQDASEPMAEEPEIEKEYLGEFEITYYTAGPESTGKVQGHPAYGINKVRSSGRGRKNNSC